ncbi:MAG: NAD(P)H-hydrate dehydratase [Gemmatimonadetes bacterium]|nr:NAD(P)H-hydrate dehydratase [Gemmatimonadota bacterium]
MGRSPAIPVLDAAQAAEWDRQSIAAGVPSRVLMESAGRAVTHVIGREFGSALSHGILVAAGHGNNGGDGWVIARSMQALGVPTWVVDIDRERSPDCEANRALAIASSVQQVTPDGEWPRTAVTVDALLGTGAGGAPRGAVRVLAERLANHGASIVAVDGPTGLDLSTGESHGPVHAHLTVTFGGLRRGHLMAREWCGRLVVVEMGFGGPQAGWPAFVHDRWAAEQLPAFRTAMHKGDRGRVLIVGGQNGMAGAVRHAARGALAAGAGLVRIATQEDSVAALQESLPDAMTLKTTLGPDVEPALAEALSWADAVVVGPGLGREPARVGFVQQVLESASDTTPVVIDADALHVGREAWGAGPAPRVLTPHEGEFRVAFPDQHADDRFTAAQQAACSGPADLTVLLKGVPTIVASRDGRTTVTASGNPALATGGSGDVLAGFIAVFLAQGMETHTAAAMGAHVLGRAAELASADASVRSVRPDDVLGAVRRLWQQLECEPAIEPPVLLRLDPPELV